MKRILPLLYSLIFFSFFSSGNLFGQSVNCPQCSVLVCAGSPLSDYINFVGYTPPVEIISITGAALGDGSALSNYVFANSGSNITINFSYGSGIPVSTTLPVNIAATTASFSTSLASGCANMTFNASSSNAPGGIANYSWELFSTNGISETLLTTLSGVSPSYNFGTGGIYKACLTVTANNGCTRTICQNIDVGQIIPGLVFQAGSNPQPLNQSDELVVAYCNSGAGTAFTLNATNATNIAGGVSINQFDIEVDGVNVYSENTAPTSATTITTAPAGFTGYIDVLVSVTATNGCVYEVSYAVYLGNGAGNPTFSTLFLTNFDACPGEELEIQTNLNASNPNGSDYTLDVMCGDASIESWEWPQGTPESLINWVPSTPSCDCPEYEYILVTTAEHPCMSAPNTSTTNFRVPLPPTAEIEREPLGNICLDETVEYQWLGIDSMNPEAAWCYADVEWVITTLAGINVPINGIYTDSLMTHTYEDPGIYIACLNISNNCGSPSECDTICVNPSIDVIELFPNWNIPSLLCPGDEFTSHLTYSNLDFCDTPEVEWELFFEGALIETYTGLTADIVDLQKGDYELVVTFILADCGEIEESTTFEVVAPPVISPQITGPVSDACEGDVICFDEWFCIDDCGDPLIDFELVLYQGFLSDCDASPSGNVQELITNQLPNPPYANCDPNTSICSYEWTAIPGQYTVWIKAENNCGPDFECITIDIPFPDTPVISGDEEVCVNGEVSLDASLPGGTFTFESCPGVCPAQGNGPGQFTTSGSTLTWDTEEGITNPGDYVISYGGDCIGTGQLTVTVYPLPEFSIESSIPTTVCEGDVVELDIDYLGSNALDGCNWVDLNTGLSISNPDCQVTVDPSPGINDYGVTVTDENGCQDVETISIEELTQPFTADCSVLQSSYCNNGGSVIDLTTLLDPYPTNGTLSWTFNGSTVSGTEIDLDGLGDGTYTLEWEWLHPTAPNCPFEGECSFDIAPPVVPILAGNAEYCQGETVTASISGSNGIQGNWNFISCPGTCPTDAVFSPFTFSWITDENDDAGTYILEYSGACLETVTYTFVLNAIPAFTIATDPAEVICGDESVTLDIEYTGASSIQECFWVNENNGTSISPPDCEITVQPGDNLTTYSVIVEDANGCENASEVDISIQTQPFTFNCASIEPVYCDNETATINLADLVSTNPGDSEFEWFLNGNTVTGTTLDIESLSAADSPFTLSYVYTSSLAPNCVFEGECGFIITDLTTPTITNNGPVCAGGELSAIISANTGLIGTWAFTSCPNNDCPTDFTSTGTSLLWQTTATTEPGDYVLTYTGDCLEDVQTIMTVNELPDISVEAVPGDVICDGGEVSLNLIYNGGGNVSCTWENLTSGASLTDNGCSVTTSLNTETESIAVFVTDDSGCASSDTIDIAIQVQPFDFSCPTISSYCDNEAVVIDFADLVSIAPSSSGFSWFLDGNLLGDSFLDLEPLDPAGSPYELSYTYDHPDAPNCGFSGSCILTISALTPPFIIADGPICLGEEITVDISQNNGFTGTWSFTDCPDDCPDNFNASDLSLTWLTSVDDTPGTYTLQYAGNCLETVTETFTVQALPDFEILSDPDATVCNGDSISLSVNNLGATDILSCEWSSSQGIVDALNCAIDVLPDGSGEIYNVEVTDVNGCQASDSIELNIQPQPFAFDCTPISSSYCDNEVVTIDLEDLTGIDPTVDFTWFLNGIPFTGQFLDIEALPPAAEPYVLTYEYLHPVAPNCLFSDSCSFSITDLTLPEISGNDAACINDSILLTSSNTNGFEGSWTFTNCPGGDCPDNIQTNADSLIWLTDASVNTPGTYEVQYTGNCLDTALFEIILLPLPSFNVLSTPGETVCVEDTITIEIEYTGASTIVSCFLTDGLGTEIPQGGFCQYTLLPENLQGPYNLEVVDLNGCINSAPFQIDIQEQPFAFDCMLESTYCDNSTDVIDLDTQISPFPVSGSLNWFINGAPLPSSSLDIFNLVPGNYSLAYVYEHGDSPFCTFSDTCNFQVTELVRPDLSGQFGYCQGETVELFADSLEGFTGEWINVSCPQPPCIPTGTNPSSFTWSSVDAPLGEYVFSYEGLCLLTETYTIDILGNPTVDWTPEDATPCLNECLPFFPDIIEDEDLFGWEYQTFSDTVQLFGNEVCFDAIGNPEELDICLWAEAYHPVQDTVFTCYVSDCETITPVFSPDNPPVAPTEACPGVVLEIGVDYSFYDDCAFTLNNTVYDDCEEILIPDGPYGTFPYMIELGYSGCSDSLFGNIFIPQPPSAELEIEYDPCIPDVFAELINLQGMALNFDWSITDNVNTNYDFLMTDDSQENPVPNPIQLSQLNLPTDTTFYIEVEVFNFCESLILQDTVNYIASPSIEIDIANTSGDLFCLPQEFDIEIGEFATAYIDSVNWIFESIYDYGNVTDTTYANLQFPPSLTFENNGQTDTVNVYVTAYNQCGLDQDTINFVLIPPNVYLEMPDYFDGVCPGDGIEIPALIVEGDPFNGCDVSSSPLIPGLSFDCSENLESVSVFIPASTPPGIYSIETTISGCGTSNDFTEIEIFTVPDVDFEFDDQVCTDTEVAFTNLTEGAVSFEWDFGEFGAPNNTSILSFPIYAYEWPGVYDVTLTAFSDSNCVASVTKPIEIFGPNPAFEIDSAQICSGGTAVVEFESQDDIISLLWEFILPGEDTLIYTAEQSVANTFFNDSNNVDVWNVSLTLEDIYGCVAKADTQVIVLPQPTAFFRHSSLEGCAQGVPIDFYNLSTANTSSTWTFDNPLSNALAIKYETNPTYEFPLPGIYTVTLLAQNQFGCEAQFARILGCNKVDVYVPNAFTPDGNSLNEVFKPVVPGIESIVFTETNFYTFQVFDRWGLMVFETNDYEEGWAGTSPDAEFYAPSDVYIWRLEINFPEGLEKYMGHVTLVR